MGRSKESSAPSKGRGAAKGDKEDGGEEESGQEEMALAGEEGRKRKILSRKERMRMD